MLLDFEIDYFIRPNKQIYSMPINGMSLLKSVISYYSS